jgi:hypothetical protein
MVQQHLPASHVVKAFNHIYAAELTTQGQPAGSPNRRALAIAGNDTAANREVAALLDQFGFDAVDMGPLSESWRIQRDTPGYGCARTSRRRSVRRSERAMDLELRDRRAPLLPDRPPASVHDGAPSCRGRSARHHQRENR